MERYYHINLLFKDGKLNEREHGLWKFYKFDNEISNNLELYFNISNILTLNRDGYYIGNSRNIDLNKDKKYTISLKFYIDKEYVKQAISAKKELYALGWSNGYIKLLDFEEDNIIIKVEVDNREFSFIVDYIKDSQWNHILISCENDILRIFYNGIKKRENRLVNPSYIFNDLKLGNYRRDLLKNKPIGPIVSYDELIVVNDCLYREEFEVPKENLSILFPEAIYEEEVIEESNGTIAAPFIFSSKDSLNDNLHTLDIVRHKDFEIKDEYYRRRISKYKFDI